MKTMNSLSGGKTSSYLAVHYPADYEVFALCCIDYHNSGKSIDKKMKQMVNDKLQKYCAHMPEFCATSEDPVVLKTMFDLEHKLGREIIWLRGVGWEQMLKTKKMIPNISARFCTTILKIQPIFEFLFKYTELPVRMRIGFRYDEQERRDRFSEVFKYAERTEYQQKSQRFIKRWKEIKWRVGEFPLIRDKVSHFHIQDYWKQNPEIQFPSDSNCLNCFWKDPQQLRKNFDHYPEIMFWGVIHESLMGARFKKDISLGAISKIGLQADFFFGTGAGCQAGFCTS
ncbi:hypothetical protein [Persicobacter diffluens]|uniref:Phosphoadenosine phosphosulphate reductase domain-containing protein n=1 Tax=Persicobacter diffluens TaxID=981 RepID=A0AAN4W5B2_9BACT|nr:hypothetical protein PEDI_51590 [Persicobacter diffluens]